MPSTLVHRPVPAVGHPPRLDLYAHIHKALRAFLADTLVRTGRIDVLDDDEMARALGQLEELLDFCRDHVAHENDFVHAAIEARQPGGADRTAHDHEDHLEAIAVLRNQAFALKAAAPGARNALALRLYRHLALFVAENLQHMQVEESVNNATLWSLYTDEELHALHERLLASHTPAQHLQVARWMIPHLSPSERAALLGGMRAHLAIEAFAGVLELVRPHVDPLGWAKLTRALDLARPAAAA